jgi:hypothetical protein
MLSKCNTGGRDRFGNLWKDNASNDVPMRESLTPCQLGGGTRASEKFTDGMYGDAELRRMLIFFNFEQIERITIFPFDPHLCDRTVQLMDREISIRHRLLRFRV